MKKILVIVSLALVLGLVIGCPNDTPTPEPNGGGNGSGSEPSTFVAVTGISGKVTSATAGLVTTLTGTVEPADATNKDIEWTTTAANASITDGKLTATVAGEVVVTATIANGTAVGTHYTENFTITVRELQVGDTGPGGGIVFQVGTDANRNVYKEISEYLGECNWYQAVGIDNATHNPENKNVAGDYKGGDFTNWSLPTRPELDAVYTALVEAPVSPLIVETDWLWSSSHYDLNGNVLGRDLILNGAQGYNIDTSLNGVRVIRSFTLNN